MDMAHTKVITTLVIKKIKEIPGSDDDYHFLKFATMSFILAMLCKARLVTQSSGDILRDRFSDVVHDYQRSNPLFFFAQGSSKPFLELLPYETFRMYGYSFVSAYVARAFYERTGSTVPTPKLAHDGTKGGYNWDQQALSDFDELEEDVEAYPASLGISDDEDDIEYQESDL